MEKQILAEAFIYSDREPTTFQNVNKRPCIINYLEQLTLNLCTTAE